MSFSKSAFPGSSSEGRKMGVRERRFNQFKGEFPSWPSQMHWLLDRIKLSREDVWTMHPQTICLKERDDFSLSFCTSLVKIFPWYMNSPTPPDRACRLTNWAYDLSHLKSIREVREGGRGIQHGHEGRLQSMPGWSQHVLTCSVTLVATSTEKLIKGLRNGQGREDLRCSLRYTWYIFV